jgi:heat shock protein 4
VKQSKKTRQTPLKYDHVLLEKTTQKEVESYFDLECKMRNQDKIINETYERKNELESIIYNNKEKLTSTYKNFVKPEDVLDKANNWLYDQGQNSSRGMYIEKIDELRPHFEPIARRYQHAEELKESYYKAQLALEQHLGTLKSTDLKHSHITN